MATARSSSGILSNFDRGQRWQRLVLQRELKMLLHEQRHLERKRAERELTTWELGRLERLCDETAEVLRSFQMLESPLIAS